MVKKYVIIDLYYLKKYKIVDIAKELNVSKQYVSKIVKQDSRYIEEKARRKSENKEKQNQYRKDFMKNRRQRVADENYALKNMHDQASREMSTGRTISNRAFRNWNSSIYKYNKQKKVYELKKGIKTSSDVPKRINWKGY